MRKAISIALAAVSSTIVLGGCAGGGAIQPDRVLFSVDSNYQRYSYSASVEDIFDNTSKVFREAGYKLDVADRATGQISGSRGKTGDKSTEDSKGLKFYALVIPTSANETQVGIKIVQVIKRGSFINGNQTELIVSDPEMYQYLFRRIANVQAGAPLGLPRPIVEGELPPTAP